ncbi:hypothetical protein [Alicyclobacillus acidiphilus]|nr:hypothetical protein [Alicyclobacillus acidiphilus]
MTSTNGKAHFDAYMASYTNPGVPASGRVTLPPSITVYEAYGQSITTYQPIVKQRVTWMKFAEVNQQTYYATNPTKPPFVQAVGFVRNHVVYAIAETPGGNISQSTLLKYLESMTQAAPVNGVSISAMGYQNALKNIHFQPFIPSSLYSTYRLESAIGNVVTTSKGTTQFVELSFEPKHNPYRQSIEVTEAPLTNKNNQIAFPSNVVGPVSTWKDQQRGLEFRLTGGTNSAEFHRVLNMFKTTHETAAKN